VFLKVSKSILLVLSGDKVVSVSARRKPGPSKPIQPISDEKREEIIADWRTGEYAQNDLVNKHKVSKGFINKLCKGLDQDTVTAVTAGIAYKSALAEICDQKGVTAAKSVVTVVDKKVKDIEFFDNAQKYLADTALKMVKEKQKTGELAMQEMTGASRVVRDSREGVVGKAPDVQIVNNQVSVHAQMSDRDLLEEARKIQERMKLIDSV